MAKTEREIRDQLYKALDQIEIFKISTIIENLLNDNDLDSSCTYSCEQYAKEFGSCAEEQERENQGMDPCQERFYRHFGLPKDN